MTRKTSCEKRAAHRFRSAVIANQNNAPIRLAAKIARLPPTTFHRRLQKLKHPAEPAFHGRRALTDKEERVICEVAVRRADIGKPYSRVGLINVVAVFCSTLSAERQSRLVYLSAT